jgi:two-component system, OmpR family, response regulator VicR
MSIAKVLLVEDELLLGRIVTESLSGRGFDMFHAPNIAEARRLLDTHDFDILLLDVMLQGDDGFAFATALRQTGFQMPIIFLTAKNQTTDVVRGFEAGGDDYLRKPFSMEELIVRIKAQLRRNPAPVTDAVTIYTMGTYAFDPVRQVLSHPLSTVQLSHREAELLKRLCQHQNQVMPRRETLLELWGDDSSFNARSMDVFISKLRRYLVADDRVQILNVRGIGYKLVMG